MDNHNEEPAIPSGHIVYNTVKSGRWSDILTWDKKEIPPDHAKIVVNNKHTLTLDITVNTCGVKINEGGTLSFEGKRNATLYSCAHNIEVWGRLVMKPITASIQHSIIFTDIDESKIVGTGMNITHDDVGLWVRGNGKLELVGFPKTPYTQLIKSIMPGDKIIYVADSTGWKVGDEITISPSKYKDHIGFETRVIISINKNTITLDKPLLFEHPSVFNPFSGIFFFPHVLNLTRNVIISGTGDGTANPETNGRAHINIGMIKNKSIISNVLLRHMGPRKKSGSYTEKILGRYGMHFHMCGDILNGTIIEGVVARDFGSHAFVPHASHGITFKSCIAYNTFEDAFWWDIPPNKGKDPINNSNYTVYDGCLAALTKADPPFRGYRLSSFLLGSGIGNTIKNCISIANQGNSGAAGYLWPESSNYTDNVWVFSNNLAYNNKTCGIFVWQNDQHPHVIDGFTAFNCTYGIEHGAYINSYKYRNIDLFNNGNSILMHSNAVHNGVKDEFGYMLSFINVKGSDPLYITRHLVFDNTPSLFKNCYFPKVIIDEILTDNPRIISGHYDFVDCNLKPEDFEIIRMEAGSRLRIQDNNSAFMIDDKGNTSQIPKFYKERTTFVNKIINSLKNIW